ncbi:SusC/RagA family TonB-linked outer membrane protein [Neolewinella agarilytica]|uniref:TonB-linked outer membrane protein, SusC/RagA family n=1 Tax=Neolewinella agarilytica TaxID=478744 RepID=A0A1H9CIM0_9BACT|nr:TonB-dependent receptor [Neolewinella agarilytica]SEQ00984.1 TonB-linked outer membrane protein, SusC/RagA family [Neolewinella agarilytica]
MKYSLQPFAGRTNRVLGLLVVFISLFTTSAYAQGIVSGQVSDESGESLIGVTVRVQGTSTGTVTDIDGTFNLEVPSDAVLEFSYTGFESQAIPVGNQTRFDITLLTSSTVLDEVVVVGYGSVQKSDITGSVSSVKSEDIQAFPVLNAGQALQGRAAGVSVQTQNGGEPGAGISIRVRGSSSLNASSDPLVVVDGFVGASFPQQNDIESIEILKDASATAIYGSRGSGGVILVTTKKGKSGKPTVELNSNYSFQETTNRLDLLDARGFAQYQNMIRTNAGDVPYSQGPADTDWQDEIYRAGNTQNHQVSVSGGGDNVNYYVSGTYFNQEGIIINSDFEKIQFLANVDAKVSDRLKIGLNTVSSRSEQNGVSTQSTGSDAIGSVNGGGDDVVALAFRFSPDVGRFNDAGFFSQNTVGDDIENPWAVATQIRNETKTDNVRTNLYADFEILNGLSFKTTLGYRTQNSTEGYFKPQTFQLSAGGAFLESVKRTNLLNENYLTYSRPVGQGNLTLLAGHSYQKNTTEGLEAGARELLTDVFSWYNLEAGQIDQRTVDSRFSESEIESVFGRVNFDFQNKYLITATVRRDGASNFAANNKYAIFPSVALGWKISQENFLVDNNTISNLKLRASYGLTGNQAIGPYESLATYRVQPPTDVDGAFGVDLAREDNPDLKWETSYQTNIGLDLGLFEGRIAISADYYNIDTKDLLAVDRASNFYLGTSDLDVLRNVGSINNKGFEFSLTSTNINKPNFNWKSNFNVSINRNQVVELSSGSEILGSGAPGYFVGSSTYILREGNPLGLFWGLEYQGVYQGGAIPEGTALEGRSFDGDGNAIPGEPLFSEVADEDGNFNGIIDDNDRQIIGDPNPDFTLGFSNSFTYKNFDLNIFLQGSFGGDIYNLTAIQLYNGDSNALTDVLNSWTPENTNTDIPRAAIRGRERSSRFVEDGSYLRLKNVALGYNLPLGGIRNIGISSARLSISAQNLLTFTNYSGLDPEVSYFGSGGESSGEDNIIQGHDYGNYPNIRSVTVGLNLKF